MKSSARVLCVVASVGALAAGCARSGKAGYVADIAAVRVEYRPLSVPHRMAPGSQVDVKFEAKNSGDATWPAGGEFPLHFGYHWEAADATGKWETISWDDSNRAGLPSDTPPGGTAVITLPVRAVPRACVGCRLVIVPLLEMKAWSDTAGLRVPVDVSS